MKNKLILIDFNNIMYISIFSNYLREKYQDLKINSGNENKIQEITRDTLKIIMLKIFNILEYNSNYNLNILFAKDGKKLWRKDIYPEYKIHRKANRENTGFDFPMIFEIFENIWNIIKEILPYRFININNIEVDDVISIISQYEIDKWDKIQIYSADGDFIQLLKESKIELYNPRKAEFTIVDDPNYQLFEKCIIGDPGDGIPNIFSKTLNERQSPIRRTRIKFWYENKKEFVLFLKNQTEDVKKNYIRNVKLINLFQIPESIKNKIIEEINKDKNEWNFNKYMEIAKLYGINEMIQKIFYFEKGLTK